MLMLSMPPATITAFVPSATRSCASIAAFMPEPHTLLIVVQPVAGGSPAPSAAWRAGAWPWPAGSTLPMIDFLTSCGATPGALDRGADGRGAELAARRAPSARP